MAQLSDDCFAFGGALMPVEEAGRLMAGHVPAVAETEIVPLVDAVGRVTASDVKSPIALPPFDNSAVDGYAVRHADVAAAGETRLRLAGRLQAGSGSTATAGLVRNWTDSLPSTVSAGSSPRKAIAVIRPSRPITTASGTYRINATHSSGMMIALNRSGWPRANAVSRPS